MNAAPAISGAASIATPAPDYFKQVFPEPYRILGLRLLPLSVGRYRLLKRHECAFVAEGEASAGIPDLLIGVLICSMRVDEFNDFANSPQFAREIKRWSKRILPFSWLGALPWIGKRWRAKCAPIITEKMALFQKYIEEAQKIPMYSMMENSPRQNSSHWSHSIEVSLRSEQHWTTDEINEQPLSKALADYFRLAESNGSLTLITDEIIETAAKNSEGIDKAVREWREKQAKEALNVSE